MVESSTSCNTNIGDGCFFFVNSNSCHFQVRSDISDIFTSKLRQYGGNNSAQNATEPFDYLQKAVRIKLLSVLNLEEKLKFSDEIG